MDLNKYRKIIEEMTLTKNLEKDPTRKKEYEDMEINFRKDFRSHEIREELDNLYINNQYIGFICVLSQFIEFRIKELILQFINLSDLTNKKLNIQKDWETQPLGGLIKILEIKFLKDVIFIKKLRDFNNLRKKAIHNLFDIKVGIEDIKREIAIKSKSTIYSYDELITPIIRYGYVVINKTIELKNINGKIPDGSMEAINKLRITMERLDPSLKNEDIEKNIKF